MKESQVCVSIYQPFIQKWTLLRMYEKLSPKKKLIFSCKMDKGIMEKTSCLRIAVTFRSHCSHLVPCKRLLPSLWWWLPAPYHSLYEEQDRCCLNVLLQCSVPSQVNPPLLLLADDRKVPSLTQVYLSWECILTRNEEQQWHQLPQMWIVIVHQYVGACRTSVRKPSLSFKGFYFVGFFSICETFK